MASAYFDWITLEEIRPTLLQHSLATVSKTKATDHLHELERVGVELHASVLARENAARLATGYDDLVVVLMEPSDRAEWIEYDGMKTSSRALQLVDETLKLAFASQRGIDNTIILDRWPFRSAKIQENEAKEEREKNNEKAGKGFESTLAELRPKVILICQCQAAAPNGTLSNQWSSSINKAGDYDIIELGNGHRCFCVYSFHPMYFEYIDGANEPLKRVLSEYLFDATFVIAANLLTGCELTGFGLRNLRNCARHGPVTIFYDNGVLWTYQWTSERNCCTDEFWALVENEYLRQRVPFKELLATYRADYLRDQTIRGTPKIGHGLSIKDDVLPNYRSRIRDPPSTPFPLV